MKWYYAAVYATAETNAKCISSPLTAMWHTARARKTGCCSQTSAHGGRTGSSMRTRIQFTASKAPALSPTHLIFLLVVQLSDCCLHISSLLSIDDITGKGVWNNLTVWELHTNSKRLRIWLCTSQSLSESQLCHTAIALTQPAPKNDISK